MVFAYQMKIRHFLIQLECAQSIFHTIQDRIADIVCPLKLICTLFDRIEFFWYEQNDGNEMNGLFSFYTRRMAFLIISFPKYHLSFIVFSLSLSLCLYLMMLNRQKCVPTNKTTHDYAYMIGQIPPEYGNHVACLPGQIIIGGFYHMRTSIFKVQEEAVCGGFVVVRSGWKLILAKIYFKCPEVYFLSFYFNLFKRFHNNLNLSLKSVRVFE